jgi:hypothetical protein
MDTKIKIVAGILFAVVFILLLAILFSNIVRNTTESTDKVSESFNSTAHINSDEYVDGATYRGSEVVALIQNATSITGDSTTTVTVKMSSSVAGTVYSTTNRYTAKISKDKSNAQYIDPSATFTLAVTKRANGTVSDYTFTKK